MRSLVPIALVVVLLTFSPPGFAQSDSRRADLDEAERLASAAEQVEADAAEAFGKLHDRSVMAEAHRKAIESMSRAVDIWVRLDESRLVDNGLDELARLYITAGAVDCSVQSATRLADYWHAHGNVEREGQARSSAVTRLIQGRRYSEALALVATVEEFAQQNHLPILYAASLDSKALALQLSGRKEEGEKVRLEAREALRQAWESRGAVQEEVPPARIPDGWVDVPGAPMFAEIREAGGSQVAALTNRGDKAIVGVTLGCVRQQDGQWEKVSTLFGVSIEDSEISPGSFFDVTREFAGSRNRWTDRPMGCDDAASAVVAVEFQDGTKWQLPTAVAK